VDLQKVYRRTRASQLVPVSSLLALLAFAFEYHYSLSPLLRQGQERVELCRHWNYVNEVNQDHSGATYSTAGLFNQTLVVNLAHSSEQDKREFVDSILESDGETQEARTLGFTQIRCGSYSAELSDSEKRQSREIRRTIETAQLN